MFNKTGFAAAALTAGLVVASTNPAASEGAYLSISGGYSFLQNSTLSGERDDLGVNVDAVKLSDSYIVGGAVGYTFKDPWRVELEAMYQNNDVEQIINLTNVLVPGNGDVDVVTATVNGVYEYRQADSALTPYIGLGLGAVYANANDIQRPGRSTESGSAFAPTGVVMLGVGYDFNDSVALTAGYRFQGIGVLSGSSTKANGTTFDGEADMIYLHSVTAGLRFHF